MAIRFYLNFLVAFMVLLFATFKAPQAMACQGPQFEVIAVYKTLPEKSAGAGFIGKVAIRNKRKWFFIKQDDKYGFEAKVLESSTHPNLVGKKVEIPSTMITSCGPFISEGDIGYIYGPILGSTAAIPTVMPVSSRGDLFRGFLPPN